MVLMHYTTELLFGVIKNKKRIIMNNKTKEKNVRFYDFYDRNSDYVKAFEEPSNINMLILGERSNVRDVFCATIYAP